MRSYIKVYLNPEVLEYVAGLIRHVRERLVFAFILKRKIVDIYSDVGTGASFLSSKDSSS